MGVDGLWVFSFLKSIFYIRVHIDLPTRKKLKNILAKQWNITYLGLILPSTSRIYDFKTYNIL